MMICLLIAGAAGQPQQRAGALFCNQLCSFLCTACSPSLTLTAIWLLTHTLQELLASHSNVLVPHSATALIRLWDVHWGQYQQKLLAAREHKREQAVRRRMQALGLQCRDGEE
jgi:hypothetical protein